MPWKECSVVSERLRTRFAFHVVPCVPVSRSPPCPPFPVRLYGRPGVPVVIKTAPLAAPDGLPGLADDSQGLPDGSSDRPDDF